eukprot:CAMPEP_0184492574 /NCGR_PEP_ID=MMETSP0113_2-20130426/23700_1 /TAXON_ID=91329 /ORGANISM="Norrisiella sphaerica, Strain BC52" /LENGTH=597 /DNA_ID=CAMNT_0026877451 /DNA_START=292 /DNA_END=2082 /DNA_ORIENTATION=-
MGGVCSSEESNAPKDRNVEPGSKPKPDPSGHANADSKQIKDKEVEQEGDDNPGGDNGNAKRESDVQGDGPQQENKLAKIAQEEKRKRNGEQLAGMKAVRSDERLFLDYPIELPKQMPDLNRDKSVWVLGPNKKAAAAPVMEYKFNKRLGSPGQFGEAWRATRLKDGKQVAVKKIAKARFMNDPKRAAKYLAVFSAEIQIMRRLDHQYCIKFYEAFEDSNYLYMSMELCTGGELFDRIVAKRRHTERGAAKILRMLFEGLAYIHHHGLAHCDLKPDNFLFLTPAEDSPIKIIDFGMAKPVPPHEYHNNFCGTPYYVAPEVIKQQGYNQSCDLWSMGVIMFLMLFGYPPFHSTKKKEGDAGHREIFRKIRIGFDPRVKDGYGPWFPASVPISQQAKDLIGSLLEIDTSKRLTAEEALHHPWFKLSEEIDNEIDIRVLKSLTDFRKQGKFKEMLLSALVDIVDDKESEMLGKVLKHMDTDDDGYISVSELEAAFKDTMAAEDIKKVAAAADIKGDEVISIEELTMVYLDRKVGQKEERLWEAFTKLDKTGNMKLSMEDIKKALTEVKGVRWSDEEIEEAFKQADLDGNGHIDYDEFLLMW